jgi:hypothetical protein
MIRNATFSRQSITIALPSETDPLVPNQAVQKWGLRLPQNRRSRAQSRFRGRLRSTHPDASYRPVLDKFLAADHPQTGISGYIGFLGTDPDQSESEK